jgi:hypothetical protein
MGAVDSGSLAQRSSRNGSVCRCGMGRATVRGIVVARLSLPHSCRCLRCQVPTPRLCLWLTGIRLRRQRHLTERGLRR